MAQDFDLDLDKIKRPVRTFKANGKRHEFAAVTVGVNDTLAVLYEQMEAAKESNKASELRRLRREIVATIAPTLSPEEVAALEDEQADALLTYWSSEYKREADDEKQVAENPTSPG